MNRKLNQIRYKLLSAMNSKNGMKVTVDKCGFDMKLPVNCWLTKQIIRRGVFSNNFYDYIKQVVKLRSTDIAIDVGANIGWYTLVLATIADANAQIISFEPCKQTYEFLAENIKINRMHSVTAIRKGVSDTNERKVLYLGYDNSLHSLLPLTGLAKSVENIETIRLDDYFKNENLNPNKVKFIKIDIEGYELPAMQGATDILKHCPLIMMEYSPAFMKQGGFNPQDLINFMHSYDYRGYYLIRGDLHEATPKSLYCEDGVDIFWKKQ